MRSFLSQTLGGAMAIVLVTLAILLASCTDEPAPLVPVVAKSDLPFPTTPDILMGNFREAYGNQDLGAYAALLHPDFQFELARGRVPQVWGRDQELAIAARMFSREDYVKPDRVIAGILRIEFVRCEGIGAWIESADDSEGETFRRSYLVHVRFHRTDESVLSVEGVAVFHVRCDELDTGDGETRPGYRIVRWIDRT